MISTRLTSAPTLIARLGRMGPAPLTIDAVLQVAAAAYSDANPFNNECNASNNSAHAAL